MNVKIGILVGAIIINPPLAAADSVGALPVESNLTPIDQRVIRLAVEHFLKLKLSGKLGDPTRNQLVVLKKTAEPGMLSEAQIAGELQNQRRAIAAEIERDLRARNTIPVLLTAPDLPVNFVIVDDLGLAGHSIQQFMAFYEKYPAAKCYVQFWLPGYARNGRTAVVRFRFGPTGHGATATYHLTQDKGQWKVDWHFLSYYA